MSEHNLPDDLSRWPKNPFDLLGVRPDASPKDVKRAYHTLIRKYKPELAPEAFQRVRAAYESVQQIGTVFGGLKHGTAVGDGDRMAEQPGLPTARDAGPVAPPDPPRRLAPQQDDTPNPGQVEQCVTPDLWEMACRGDEEAAYRCLRERLDVGMATEEVFLQLYWLRVASPGVDPGREPSDWLIRGLKTCNPPAHRLRELLRRESDADPPGAIGEEFASLLTPGTPNDVILHAALCRWRAARVLRYWQLIIADVESLRGQPIESHVEVWIRLLLTAAGNVIWTLGAIRDTAQVYKQEADRLAQDHSLDISNNLTELEYGESVMKGLARMYLQGIDVDELHRLLSQSWDDRGPALRYRLLPFVHALARQPRGALECLDSLRVHAPAALGLLRELMDRSTRRILDPRCAEGAETFLAASRWWNYAVFRPRLLAFCLREMIAPDAVARLILNRPEYEIGGGSHLAHSIMSDWPLLLIYQACEVAWE